MLSSNKNENINATDQFYVLTGVLQEYYVGIRLFYLMLPASMGGIRKILFDSQTIWTSRVKSFSSLV